jgi:hypothetical protein
MDIAGGKRQRTALKDRPMTNDPPGGMPGRRPPTIDAIASEIESWPVTKESSAVRDGEPATGNAAPATAAASPEAVATEPSPMDAAQPPPEPPDAAPKTSAAPPPEAAAAAARGTKPPRQGVGFLGVVGAGLLGGAIAAALAVILVDRLPLRDNSVRGLDTRLLRAEQQLRELVARPLAADAGATDKALEEIAGRLARLEAAPAPSPPPTPVPAAAPDAALAGRIGKLEADLKALGDSVAGHGRRVDEAAAAARAAQERASANAAAVADLGKRPPAPPAPPAVARGEVEALAARVADLAKKPPDANDRVVRLALAATLLRAAVDRGEPFAPELASVKALAPDPKLVAALEPLAATGAPTAPALARELAALAPALHAAAGNAPGEGSFLERLQANAQKIVRIRPLEEVPGDEAAPVIARMEVKVTRGDLAGALAELPKLPEGARAAAEPWAKRAQARVAAVDASRRLATDALAGLAK